MKSCIDLHEKDFPTEDEIFSAFSIPGKNKPNNYLMTVVFLAAPFTYCSPVHWNILTQS